LFCGCKTFAVVLSHRAATVIIMGKRIEKSRDKGIQQDEESGDLTG